MDEDLVVHVRAQERPQTLDAVNRIDRSRYWICDLLDEIRTKGILSTQLCRLHGKEIEPFTGDRGYRTCPESYETF